MLKLDGFSKIDGKLSDFSSINDNITSFIKDKAVEFEKRDLSSA